MRKRKAKPLGRSCSAVTPLSTWIWKCLKLHIVLHKSAFHPHETSESTHSPGTHRSLSFLNCYLGVFFFGSDASANSCRRLRLQLRPGPHQSSNPGKLKSLTNISNPHKFRRGEVAPVWIHPSLGIHFLLNYLFCFQFSSMARLACMLIVPSGTCKPCQTQNRLARVWDRSPFARLRFEPNDSTICIGFSLLLKWRVVVVKTENIDFIACNMTGNKCQQSRKQKIVIHHFESASSSYDELFVIAFLFLTRWLRYFGKPSDIIHQ